MIVRGPRVGSISTCSVRETVENTLVGERFRAKEDQVLERVWSTRVIKDFGGDDKVGIGLGLKVVSVTSPVSFDAV
jgi:hypothetical protein